MRLSFLPFLWNICKHRCDPLGAILSLARPQRTAALVAAVWTMDEAITSLRMGHTNDTLSCTVVLADHTSIAFAGKRIGVLCDQIFAPRNYGIILLCSDDFVFTSWAALYPIANALLARTVDAFTSGALELRHKASK
jgi:hypothetical protein